MFSRLEFSEDGTVCRLNNFPASHFFTAAQAGSMTSKCNFEPVFRANALTQLRAVSVVPPQEHSDSILFAPSYCREEKGVECDGLFTTSAEVALVLRPADCFPILMTTIDRYFVGLVHAGWRGTDLEIARQAVELTVKHYPIEPEDIFVGIGPGIHKSCYNDEELANDLYKDDRWKPFIKENSFGTFGFGAYIDLLDFNVKQLLGAGIKPEHIKIASNCACCSRDEKGNHLFFSHHRAERTGETEGRFAAVISRI